MRFADNLVRRVSEGLLSAKYKAIDYDKLKQLTAEKKFSAHLSLAKVKKLEHVSKQHKEQNITKQHKRVWDEELLKQNAHRRRAQADLDLFIQQNRDGQTNRHFFKEFEDYESFLEDEFMEFKKCTVDPVWTLRDDLLYWLHEHQPDLKNPSQALEKEHERVLETVHSVKAQQRNLLEQLRNEQISLENELRAGELPEIVCPTSVRQIETGIPAEAFELECPDEDLKASVLQEFIFIDEKYLEKFEDLEDKHKDALGSDTGNWAPEDHFAFLTIIEQYPFDVQNRRTLYMDRLQRQFPKMTRAALVAHEDWWFQYKYFHDRKKALINDWIRDRRELLNRASVVFNEVCMALEVQEAKSEYQERQRELCQALCRKVQSWREQKMEALQLKQEVEEARHAEELRQQEQQQQREQARRQKDKEKMNAHRMKLEAEQQKKAEEDRQKLAELQKVLAEQAMYDKQRVQFREQQTEKKLEERLMKEMAKREEDIERERVLEAIREQVRPNVEGDLLRLWSDTEAWHNHIKPNRDPEADLQKPLFEINTFSASQVSSDPRVRLEHQLRQAGLINNDYARQAVLQMKPLQAPRRDMQSTVFKQE